MMRAIAYADVQTAKEMLEFADTAALIGIAPPPAGPPARRPPVIVCASQAWGGSSTLPGNVSCFPGVRTVTFQ
jgi:hypothetical protein